MEKLTMTVEEAGKVLGISRPTAYKLVQPGRTSPWCVWATVCWYQRRACREWVKKEAGVTES